MVSTRRRAYLLVELFVASPVLGIAVMSMVALYTAQYRLLKHGYNRAVAMEVVDGEKEVLVAGEREVYGEGTHTYLPESRAVEFLPGEFTLSVEGKKLRLE